MEPHSLLVRAKISLLLWRCFAGCHNQPPPKSVKHNEKFKCSSTGRHNNRRRARGLDGWGTTPNDKNLLGGTSATSPFTRYRVARGLHSRPQPVLGLHPSVMPVMS